MKKQYAWLVLITAAVLIALLSPRLFRRGPGPRYREELPSLPGAVVYQAGHSAVPELFQEAKALLAKGEFAKAETVYREILDSEPDSAAGHIGLAACRFYLDDLAGAEEQYRRALTLEPRSAMALTGLGSVAYRRGDYRAAVQSYQQALAVDADLADAHWGIAISYDAIHDDEQALKYFERFVQLAPQSNLADGARTRVIELRAALGKDP